jgi:hypothetical protein
MMPVDPMQRLVAPKPRATGEMLDAARYDCKCEVVEIYSRYTIVTFYWSDVHTARLLDEYDWP